MMKLLLDYDDVFLKDDVVVTTRRERRGGGRRGDEAAARDAARRDSRSFRKNRWRNTPRNRRWPRRRDNCTNPEDRFVTLSRRSRRHFGSGRTRSTGRR